MNRLCTICARGGSKGVKNKNLREIAGYPLIAISIEQAKRSQLFSAIAVSSDSPFILAAAEKAGANILIERPAELATDTAAKIPVIQHALTSAESRTQQKFDVVVDLDATSPLRTVADIQGAIQLLQDTKASNVITGSPARRSPYFNLVEERPDHSVGLAKIANPPIVRRQDAPRCFDMNASIYVWWRDELLNCKSVFTPTTRLLEMKEEHSLDIDSELDFELVNWMAQKYGRFQNEW